MTREVSMGAWGVSWSDVPGNVSYVLIALSYWMTNVFWLRVIAVVGLVFEILYFQNVRRRHAHGHWLGHRFHNHQSVSDIPPDRWSASPAVHEGVGPSQPRCL